MSNSEQVPDGEMEEMLAHWSGVIDHMSKKALVHSTQPVLSDLEKAHRVFLAHETRERYYREATRAVEIGFQNRSRSQVVNGLIVLLEKWNLRYYQTQRIDPRGRDHLVQLEQILNARWDRLLEVRHRNILTFRSTEGVTAMLTFLAFEGVLGAVGSAKALHLLAPLFFPLWDRKIASKSYGLPLNSDGMNGARYVGVMRAVKSQCGQIQGASQSLNLLKLIDELNMCRDSRNWLT
ncbi:MAG: hypothetical protein Q7T05_04885 [Dehalococcoidia bacterium]|nr:hypothetical protein [Dehalococcoidia bacterium]